MVSHERLLNGGLRVVFRCGQCLAKYSVVITKGGDAWIEFGWRSFIRDCGYWQHAEQHNMALDDCDRFAGRSVRKRLLDYALSRKRCAEEAQRQKKFVYRYAA